MNCEKCCEAIPKGDECKKGSQVFCEDCYIAMVEPLKTCDVAAVHAAKKHRAAMGQTGTEGLTDLQKKIVVFIEERGKATKQEVADRFNLKNTEMDNQFAVLRHCEVLKAKKIGGELFLVPFDL